MLSLEVYINVPRMFTEPEEGTWALIETVMTELDLHFTSRLYALGENPPAIELKAFSFGRGKGGL